MSVPNKIGTSYDGTAGRNIYNEESCLADSLNRLHSFLSAQDFAWDWEIVLADNGSTDRTAEIAEGFVQEVRFARCEGEEAKHAEAWTTDKCGTTEAHDRKAPVRSSPFRVSVRVVSLRDKGRGRALKHVWLNADADVLVYMDAYLSTDLNASPNLVNALAGQRIGRAGETEKSVQYDLAIGSRLLQPRLTTRSFKREFISRCYNRLIKVLFPNTTFSDAQCGFKAITRSAAQTLLPQVEDSGWFFDTELLLLAEHHGYRIFDLPVRWIERRNSSVKILRTAIQDIRGLIRIWRKLKRPAFEAQPLKVQTQETADT